MKALMSGVNFFRCENCEEINCFLENILVTDEYSKMQWFFLYLRSRDLILPTGDNQVSGTLGSAAALNKTPCVLLRKHVVLFRMQALV